jgi:hypothetical protein
MWKTGMDEKQAIEFIRKRRGFIDPNIGFVGQLMGFNEKLKALRNPGA